MFSKFNLILCKYYWCTIYHGSNEEAAVRKTVKQYGNATTVHGISYILEQGRHPLERLLWIVLVLTGFVVFFYLTTTICTERENNPVMTTVETTGYNIENIEFPSITVCPQGSVKKIKVLSSLKMVGEGSSVGHVCLEEIEKIIKRRMKC